MNVWKMFKKGISVVIAIAIVLSLAAPVLADAVPLSDGSIGYLAMGDDMSNGIGLENPEEDTYAVKVAKKLYGDNWESSYKLRAGSKYRVEELRYLIDKDYNGDGYTEQFYKGAAGKPFWDAKKNGDVIKEVKSADYITISAGVNNFSTYIIEQMLYFVENGGKTKYSYDIASVLDNYAYGKTSGGDVYGELENIKTIVKNELMAAAGDTMDDAVELVDFVAEVSTYAVLSYCVNFNELISEIKTINPDAKIYVVGIYNPVAGEKVSVTVNGQYHDVEIGRYFGALLEIANAYAQILAPRVYDYTYVNPGNPELLIDVMGDSSLTTQERIPDGLAIKLASDANAEASAVKMIQDMFAEYGIEKSYDDAADLAYAILDAEDADERMEILKEEIDLLATDVVLEEFRKKLADPENMFGDLIEVQDPNGELIDGTKIAVTDQMVLDLLVDLENEATRTAVAEEFVVDLMTKAMIGKNIDGYVIENQDDAYAAIELLRQNATVDNSDPTALREAAAAMVINKIGKDNILGITESDIVTLLELMDGEPDETKRKDVVVTWLNDNTVRFITETVQDYVPGYTEADAEALLAAMDASDSDDDSAIAKEHLLTHFTPVLAEKMEEKYIAGGFELQTFASFTEFATAINTADNEADVKELVRNEIRAAAAVAIYEYATGTTAEDEGGNTLPLWSACACVGGHNPATCSGLSLAMVQEMLITMDSKATQAEKDAALRQWLITYMNGGNEPSGFYESFFFNPVKVKFLDAYNSYNDAATTAENMCADYHSSVNDAAEAFGSYAELKAEAADEIYSAYEHYYKSIGDTAKQYYDSYVSLRDTAVEKVLEGYDQYQKAMEMGMDSLEPLNGVFDKIFELLCEIAEVETISLNDILAVAKKVKDGSYIKKMVDTLITGGNMAKEDKTVAYLALRYYLADSMMIMPSASGHQTIANQIIKAIDGKDTSSTGGYYANKVIDKAIDVYRCANAYRDLSSSESGQAKPVINPDLYVALGDNVTSGSALDDAALAYPQLVADALAMAADDRDGADKVCNYAINGMRVEELLMLVDDSYNGDEYTADRFGTDYIASLREQYRDDIANADLITINVGINNMVTYPATQTLLAYNGEEPYEMDWERFIGSNYAGKIEAGKDAAMKLTLALVDNAESRSETLEGLSAYERCERALNTMFTAIESTLYSYISYIFTLDDAVEQIAALNKEGTIALIGFYNPLEGTYFQIDRTVTVRGKTIDLSQFDVNVDRMADMMLNLVNRYHANYVGSIDGNGTAADEGSRLLNVKINDTELFVTNDEAISKDLSTLVKKEITIKGKTIPVMVPEYFVQPVKSEGEVLHPNAAGHKYIADQILKALDFEIYADVIVEDYTKTYGDADPDFTHLIDDLSSLWNIEVTDITREPGEEVGTYALSAVYTAEDGYTEIDEEFGNLEITKRAATITVTVKDGQIINVVYDNVLDADKVLLEAADLTLSGAAGAYEVTSSDAYIARNYELTIEVEEEESDDLIKWAGTNTKLGGILELNFALKADQFKNLPNDNYIVLTRTYANGKADDVVTIPQSEWGTAGADYFKVTYSTLAAKEMGDVVTGVVYNAEGKVISEVHEDSIATYSMRMLRTRKDINTNPEARTLFVDMLNYGAAAQVFFGYNTENLVNADLTTEEAGWATQESVEIANAKENSDNYVGTNLDLENEILMQIAFREAYTDGMYAVVTYTDHYGAKYERTLEPIKQGNFVIVRIDDIAVADYRTVITCKLYNADKSEIGYAIDSREYYVARNTAKLQKNGVDLGDAIMKFGASAYDYFRSIEK